MTSGPAFDMQPRFSPDGKRIALASDRDGLWNIWTMELGRQATRSRSRASGAGSSTARPGRPTATTSTRAGTSSRSARSAPAKSGCIHAAGPTDGLQVTERNGWQKDAGEPDISPDGRLSLLQQGRHARARPSNTTRIRTAPSTRSSGAICSTGRERRAVSVQGGSVTPQVSPDGKTLAYVRRVRLQSFLYLRDLESGRDRQLFGNVDKDLQEAWAIHGLYPQYAWTPDGKSIVIWGEGKIWRVDVASGKGQPIPFTARVEQTINDAVRFPREAFTPTSSRSACCATSASRPTASTSSTARSAISTCRPLPDGEPRAPDAGGGRRKPTPTSSSRRSRATASGSSTRPGTTPRSAACA